VNAAPETFTANIRPGWLTATRSLSYFDSKIITGEKSFIRQTLVEILAEPDPIFAIIAKIVECEQIL
jgi:hypothetical protein